jgi:acetyl-CoA carboxylase biotin carboxyl carrier protein|tara:strand:+ start:811 stop:1008 length:198 start_codon:yes stop_codon:yes gene_type:complete
MSGSILELLVEVGTSVTVGQELLVLESMKMEIPVESPVDGKIAEILISVEDAVEEGETILRIDES